MSRLSTSLLMFEPKTINLYQQMTCKKLDAKLENFAVQDINRSIEDSQVLGQLSEKLDANLERPVVNLDSSDDIEEGQIPGDFWSSDQSLELVHETMQLEDQKLDRGSPLDLLIASISVIHSSGKEGSCKMVESIMFDCDEKADDTTTGNSKGQDCNLDNFQSPKQHSTCQNKPLESEAVQVGAKRKKDPLSAERKAKKKLICCFQLSKAKRLKRAQKEREQD